MSMSSFTGGVENVYVISQQIYSGNCTKLHQNHPSFVGNITKIFWSLFSGHSVFLNEENR